MVTPAGLAILEVGPRGPKAVAAGEAWPPAGSGAADSAAVSVEEVLVGADFVVEAGAKAHQRPVAKHDEIQVWRMSYVASYS